MSEHEVLPEDSRERGKPAEPDAEPAEATSSSRLTDSAAVQASSYRYLRIAMVCLLLALAAAVFYQSSQQGSILASVSAYYYTPAQVIFVGALIGLGASMIALQGSTRAEDMFLNLGGMFAIVVAAVPTGRGADFRTAVQACRESGGTLLTHRASANLDCPTVLALQDASRANVQDNMTALLIVGGLILILTAVILLKGKAAKRGSPGHWWVLAGFFAALLVWLGALIALAVSVDWLANNAHYIAAGGLLLSILLVAGANAHRKEKPRAGDILKGNILKSPQDYRYTWVAGAMLVAAGVLIVLWLTSVISLFWVEILVALVFVLFWITQTVDFELEARTG